jgi:hypothetical protein
MRTERLPPKSSGVGAFSDLCNPSKHESFPFDEFCQRHGTSIIVIAEEAAAGHKSEDGDQEKEAKA